MEKYSCIIIIIVGTLFHYCISVCEIIKKYFCLQVLLGGRDIRSTTTKLLHDKFGFVGQEPVLFDTTISENIGLGKDMASFEEIQEAAKAANAHDFITSDLPDAYDTNVGKVTEMCIIIRNGCNLPQTKVILAPDHVPICKIVISVAILIKSVFRSHCRRPSCLRLLLKCPF